MILLIDTSRGSTWEDLFQLGNELGLGNAEQCLHRVVAGRIKISGSLKENYMSFFDTRDVVYTSPRLSKLAMCAVASSYIADLHAKANDLKHDIATLYINNGNSERTMQFLLSGLRIDASSSLHVLTVTADSTRWLAEVKPLLSGMDAEGSKMPVRDHAQIMRRRRLVKIPVGNRIVECRSTIAGRVFIAHRSR